MESPEIKILIADDHGVVREGIMKTIKANFPTAEFGEASDAVGVLRLIHTAGWNLVILDISMPGRNGMEVLKEIKET